MKTFLFTCLWPLQIFAQDISGIWKGYIQTSEDKLPFELVISDKKRKLDGYSLTIFLLEGRENMGVKSMKMKRKNNNLLIEDEELIYDNYTTKPRRVKLSGNLFFDVRNNLGFLDGPFKTRSLDFRDNSTYEGVIHLQKQNHLTPTTLTAKLDELNLLNDLSFRQPKLAKEKTPTSEIVKNDKVLKDDTKPATINKTPATQQKENKKPIETPATQKAIVKKEKNANQIKNNTTTPLPAAAIAERKTEIIRTVSFSADSLVLSLYDNGAIDGDTVSVVLNDIVIIAKKGLTAFAIKTVIHILPSMGDSLQLVMYAENLGSIPPNTGLLVIQDGATRHEIRFAGDLEKSSAIILKRKKETFVFPK